ncbi:MAG: BtpA/SgcQ family protein, partial [Actinobacteria bacterium]|nr:BtpA/SgcQ family protein [Actinomycetota bacterium]
MGPLRFIGMVHLGPLPGSPDYDGDLQAVIDAAVADATTLAAAGFDGVMVENFGDAPFFADDVPKVTVAAMTKTVDAVTASRLPIGVNVLRNDALAALSIAAATGAAFIRVNVLSGSMFTDQGEITGKAAEVARLRAAICPDVAVMADVFVKHAMPPAGVSLAEATRDLAERGGADAVIVSGASTGAAADLDDLAIVADATSLPVYVGSGVTADSVAATLKIADGVIVGTATKPAGRIDAPVDADLAAAIIRA